MITDNQNFLGNLAFKIVIEGDEFANVEYFITNVDLPGLTLGESASPFRNEEGYFNGDTINYDPLTVSFAIDEEMKNYEEIYNWIMANREGIKFKDITLSILNSHNTTNRQFKFISCFPTNLPSLSFDLRATDVAYQQASVTFRYDRFEMIPQY